VPIAPRRPAKAALAGQSFSLVTTTADVAVFIDWQNTYKSAREAFGWWDYPNEYGNYSPLAAARLFTRGNGRLEGGRLVRVNVHRGLPSQKFDKRGYAANRKQAAAWMAEDPELVVPRLRPLRYSREEPPREKGVDVELAVAAVEFVLTGRCDVAVIFSHDTDLVPAVELLVQLRGTTCVETAAWSSATFNRRLRTKPPVHHHAVSAVDFERIERRINYAHA